MTRAAVFTNVRDPLEVWGITHQPLEYGQVLIKVLSAGICGAQLLEIDGFKGNHFPRLMGHEGVGIVQKVGIGVKTVKEGEKVVIHWRPGAGIESDFPQWNHPGGRSTAGLCTTWSTETVISENRCTSVPSDTPNDLCVLLGCGLSTALGVVENELNLQMGQRVLIIGCGGVGMNLILASRLRQAAVICVLDTENSKESLALDLGATHFTSDWEYLSAKFDAIVDTTGNIGAIESGLQLIAPHGTFVMLGHPKARQSFIFHNAVNIVHGSQCIKGTQGGQFKPEVDIPRYTALWRSRGLDLNGIITDRFLLEDINEAVTKVRSGNAGRVLIEMP
jgi:S-(hydroxymethyl)glutathione dehydrogenase/alcohol dehydrogenase